MARALATRGHSVIVSRRNETVSAALAREHDSISVADNQEVLDHSDVVILSLRAQVAQEVLPRLAFRSDQTLISVMAGVTLAELAEFCAPTIHISLTIPFPLSRQAAARCRSFPPRPSLRRCLVQKIRSTQFRLRSR